MTKAEAQGATHLLARKLEAATTQHERMFLYIEARQKADLAAHGASDASDAAKIMRDFMEHIWRATKSAGPLSHGVYAFKDHGRACVVVGGGDYPEIVQIVGAEAKDVRLIELDRLEKEANG